MKKIIASFFVLSALLWSGWLVAKISEGFYDFNGKATAIEKYTNEDQWTVVMFWDSDCQVCNAESQQYVDFHHRHKDAGVQVLGVSMDGLENKQAAQQFIDRNKVSFPNLIIDSQLGANFYTSNTGENWIGTPSFMIYAPKGELKAAQIGAVPTQLIEDFITQNR